MSQSLPHLTLTISTSSLSPISSTSPFFPTVSPTHTRSMALLRCSTAEWRINTNPISHRLRAQIGRDRSDRDRSDRAWRLRAQENTGKMYEKLHYRRRRWIWKVWAETSYFQSQMHSDDDSAESIEDSDLENGELRKMLASPLYRQDREDCSSNFTNADPSTLGRSLLDCNNDHLLSQARSELVKQEHQVGSLKRLFQWASATSLFSKIGITGRTTRKNWISTRTSSSTRKLSLKEKVLRDTQIGGMHEMEKWRELKNYELTKSQCQNWEKIMSQYTSSLLWCGKQVNSMYDSGEFQDVESNYSGTLSHVSSQPAVIPSSRSMLSRDRRLPLDTWNTSGITGKFFG